MARGFALLFPFLFFTNVCFCQIHDTTWTSEVSLHGGKYIKPGKRIPLLESDSFTIYSSFNLLVANVKSFIDEHEIEEDILLLNCLLNTSKSLERNLEDIKNDKTLKSRLDFRTADLIQRRNCLVYNKSLKLFESMIFVTNYVKNWWTGIRFTNQADRLIMDLRTGAY